MANRFLIICGGVGINLLGQRRLLGFDAELQIDVSRENVSREWKIKDGRALYVNLDERVGTAAVAFTTMIKGDKEKKNIREQEKRHAQLLTDLFPASMTLEHGLAQSPAVGYAAISHPNNVNALDSAIREMLVRYGREISPENAIEVWIVSSTAGGTGEGVHRFVARRLSEIVTSTFSQTPLMINFIRVGQLTFRSINYQRTSLNTFLGIAADSAFMLQAKDYPTTATNWYYVDLPDVGMGDYAKGLRGEIAEMACKTIMLPDLQEKLQILSVNNVGAPIVLIRFGYWKREIEQQQQYIETLKQLITKLSDLLEPNYTSLYIEGKREPIFTTKELEIHTRKISTQYISNQIQKGWAFPRYKLIKTPYYVTDVTNLISDFKKSIHELLEFDIDNAFIEYTIEELQVVGQELRRNSIPLGIPSAIPEDGDWFTNINDIHRVKAWSSYLLGLDRTTRTVLSTGLIIDLFRIAEQISKDIHHFAPFSSTESKAHKLANGQLLSFIEKLVQVNYLLRLENSATRILTQELQDVKEILDVANQEYIIASGSINTNSSNMIRAAELDTILDKLSRKTWLRLLRDSARRGNLEQFRQTVIYGAVGLTEEGLLNVLGLPSYANHDDIQKQIVNNFGKMISDNGEEYEGQWWQATAPPAPTLTYNFRILPTIDESLRMQLVKNAEKSNLPFRYIFVDSGVFGSAVSAIECISLNRLPGDTVSAPSFLLHSFVPLVRQTLSNWLGKPEPNSVSGQFQIVVAGSGSEYLYGRVLQKAGLSDDEIKKINEYYTLYDVEIPRKTDLISLVQKAKKESWREITQPNNAIFVLPPEIVDLSSLETIDFSGNFINEIPSGISKLGNLKTLNLARNRITSLPPEIGMLKHLEKLDVRNNQLTTLPTEILQLTNLKTLNLRGNKLPIPSEILIKTNQPSAILSYYFEHRKGERRSLKEIKLIFVGEGSVGKTSIAKQMMFGKSNKDENKTEGIEIYQWTLLTDNGIFQFNIWDFGGQEIMHATHQFFLTKRSLYLLVVDARNNQEQNQVEYWLKIIQSFGGVSPVLIVGNKTDQHPLDIDRTGLQKKYPNIVGILETSAATGAGIEELKAAITEQVNNLPHVRDLLPETWFTVKTKLEKLGKQSNFITHDKYLDLCAENEVSDETSQRTLIGFLHDLGVVLHFQDDPRLEALGILNPQWVTNGVYKILNSHTLFQNIGVLTTSMLDEILNLPEYPRGKRLFIVDMMKKFELCYDIESDKTFLVPDLLPKDQPDLKFNGVPAFEYAYPVLPSSVITRFIVRMNQKIDDGLVWRTGVVLKIGENKALVKADIEDRKITIAIEGLEHKRREAIFAIRYELGEIHNSIKGLNPQQRVPIPDAPEAEPLDYDYLLQLERDGFEEHPVKNGNRLVKVNVRKLLSGVVSETERKQSAGNTTNIYIGGDVSGNLVAGNDNDVQNTRIE